jgi:CRISPR/Cas system-associated exonuclease Cas4 (RecB family)
VQTEVSILLPGGTSLRLDRWLTQRSKNVLIDYKTGDKKAADRAQMAEYVTVLRQMGLTDVKTYLVYLQPLEIEPVTGATTLNLFE